MISTLRCAVAAAVLAGHASAFVAPALRASRTVRAAPSTALRAIAAPPALEPQTVGVVGATGAVGQEILGVLANRGFPVKDSVKCFTSARSAGKNIDTAYGELTCEEFSEDAARQCDVVFLAVDGDFAKAHAENIADGVNGALVVDNSSAFRYDKGVPLVIPEINAAAMKGKKLVANPNCTTSIALMALWPLHLAFGLKRVIMSTYQAASGAGAEGMAELERGVTEVLNGEKHENEFFAHQLPFNIIPHIDVFQENGYTKEEMKVTWETRKICGMPDDFPVSCTCVRIPTLRAHGEAITIETEKPIDVAQAKALLAKAPGVKLTDSPADNLYPMPLTASKQYDVEVGRLRESQVFDNGLDFFVVGDQLLRGAALNAVLVAEASLSMDHN